MIDRSIFQERLVNAYNYLLDKGLVHTKQQFANAIGKSSGDVSSALNNYGRVLTMGFLKKVADAFPDVLNREYLLDGVGSVEKVIGKPHIPFEVSAGGVASALGSATLADCEILPTFASMPHYDFTIEVRGDSMSPSILSGDTLYCRWCGLNTVITHPTKFYVVDSPDGAVVKNLSVKETFLVCSSINPKYVDFTLPIHDDMRFAMVVGFVRSYE
jgi:SOS-response transcriptional repressor LexA